VRSLSQSELAVSVASLSRTSATHENLADPDCSLPVQRGSAIP